MKICVYAIAKNEEQFVDRFCDAAAEADYVAVLDTGSSDRTLERLRERGCIAEREIISPWRFDVARNHSLELIPEDTDVCVCVDLDEVLQPGWREQLELAWMPDADLGKYTCVCSWNADGTTGTAFLRDKIHRRGAVCWKYPVHEVLEYIGGGLPKTVYVPAMLADHLPDRTKSRGNYLPLLELAVAEDPGDARCAHYLGREYMYYGRWADAIRELERHLSLPSATWLEERGASMRYLAACEAGRGDHWRAWHWAVLAVAEVPDMRESWYAAEKACYDLGDWDGVVYFGARACASVARSTTAINEADAWGPGPHDLLALGYWNTGRPKLALKEGERAAELAPEDARIMSNLNYYRKAVSTA